MSFLSESNIFLSKIFNQKNGLTRTSSNMTLMKMARSKQDHRVEDKAQSLRQLTALQSQRTNHLQFFSEYRIMDNNFTIIKAALDIYAEETMNRGLNGNVIKIDSPNAEIVKELETLFFKVLKINKNGYLWWRDTCKFGNTYAYIESNKIDGVTGLVLLPPDSVFKNNFYQNLYGDDGDKFVWQNMVLEPWEIVHWKNTESIDNEPYGQSILRCLIETWRRVVLMREALIIYRITRAPSRYLFKVDTTGLDSDAADRFVQEVRKAATKKPMIDPKTGNMNFDYNALPIHKDSKIPLLDGRIITIEELSKEYQEGKENYVYSIKDDTNEIVEGKVVWCGKNYTANKLIRVWLDDKSYIDSAPEHPFILRDGSTKRADELLEMDSLMPFYTDKKNISKNIKQYERVYNPYTDEFEFTHRLIAKKFKKKNKNTIHHKDFNKLNNCSNNLQWTTFNEHSKMHSELMKRNWSDKEWANKLINKTKQTKLEREALGLYEVVKQNQSIRMKNNFLNPDFKENISKKNREYLVNLYSTEKGKNRKINIGLAATKYNTQIKWSKNNRDTQIKSISKNCSNEIFEKILQFINENNRCIKKDILKYINCNLIEELNSINKRDCSGITENWLEKQFRIKLGKTYLKYKKELGHTINKNHKVSKIEILDNVEEDVYCMTVVGENNSDDRHNFAVATNGRNGIFVKNSIEDNVYVPTEEGSQTDVSILEGASNLNDVEDYKIIKDDIFAGLKIPKSHLGFEEDLSGKANLADEDNRFSRVILRHQNEFIEGIVHIATVHLFLKGYKEEEIESFSIQMFNPNSIAENKKLELTKTRVELFDSIWKPDSENFQIMSYRDACKTVMQMSDEEIDRSIKQQLLEKKLAKKYGFIAEDSAEETGDMGEEGGGEEDTNEFGGVDTPETTKPKGPQPKLGKLNFESENSLKSKILKESVNLR